MKTQMKMLGGLVVSLGLVASMVGSAGAVSANDNLKAAAEAAAQGLTKTEYAVSDYEFFNWLTYNAKAEEQNPEAEPAGLAGYSSELKQALGYKNFALELRSGEVMPLRTVQSGLLSLMRGEEVYYTSAEPISVVYDHLFYVANDAEDLAAAVQARLQSWYGEAYTAELSEKTLEEQLMEMWTDGYDGEATPDFADADEYAEAMMGELVSADDGEWHYLESHLEEKPVEVTGVFGDKTFAMMVLGVKDSTKMVNTGYVSVDVESDVEVSSSIVLPLGTMLVVEKLTEGDVYDKIVELLNDKNVQMFDVKLNAGANGFVDKGTFQVKVPISDELKDKELVAYYVGEDEKITEYAVEVVDGYAVFTTDHFSVYTVAEKKPTEVPNTLDNVYVYLILGGMSLIGVAVMSAMLKRKA